MKDGRIKELRINSLRGNNVLRVFWASWLMFAIGCVSCIEPGVYTVIVGCYWSCSPSSLSAAVQLLSLF